MQSTLLDDPVVIDSPFPPAIVFDNLRARAREWRESRVPRLGGVPLSGFAFSSSGNHFSAKWNGEASPLYNPICVGTVEETRDGSRLALRFELRRVDILRRVDRVVLGILAVMMFLIVGQVLLLFWVALVLGQVWLIGRGKTGQLRDHLLAAITEAATRMPTVNPAFTRAVSSNGP